jgi:putative zinc finger protein
MTGAPPPTHEQWLVQIDAELDGELSLVERAALAKHLATCTHCAGARASHLEVRVALARSAGNPHAFAVPRPVIRPGTLGLWVAIALGLGLLAGWGAGHRSRKRVGRSSSISAFLIALAAGGSSTIPMQGPGTRLTYRIRVIEPASVAPRVLASGAVSGPLDTDMRLTLHTDSVEVEALFQVTPIGDTVNLGAEFFTKRRVGRSRRGLAIWEDDAYRRVVRLAWDDTARVYPFGSGRRGAAAPRKGIWVELILERAFAGGEARPAEAFTIVDTTRDFRLEAVVRPRRAHVVLNLVRGDTVSAPRPIDLIPEEPPRIVRLVLGKRVTTLELSLTRPDPPRSDRERALAIDADVVCLRIVPRDVSEPLGVMCGRLNNVARQLPLPSGDTLTATFAWPGPR